MVDWTVPQPSYEELHAKLDALTTERNAAVAEAKLWLRRLQTAQQERDQARSSLQAAEKDIDSWEAANAELLRELRRLEVRYNHLLWDADTREAMIKFLDPLLPVELQRGGGLGGYSQAPLLCGRAHPSRLPA